MHTHLESRERSAYRQSGRALVGMLTSGADPTCVALGGRCAEELVFGSQTVRDEPERYSTVLALLRANRWRLDSLAAALLKYETLDESMAHAAAGLPEPGAAPGSLVALAFGFCSE